VTPDEVVAIAKVVSVVVAGLFGITEFIVGLVGPHHAQQAKEAAAGANLIVKDANSIATQATLYRPRQMALHGKPTTARAIEVGYLATRRHLRLRLEVSGLFAVRNEASRLRTGSGFRSPLATKSKRQVWTS
jgi:hypothetical protein